MFYIWPKGGRFAAQMNAAAKLALSWQGGFWVTTDEEKAAKMRKLGARVQEGPR